MQTKYKFLLNAFIFSTTQYLIPLSIAGISYISIGFHIWKRDRLGAMTSEQLASHTNRKWTTIKMLVLVLLVFAGENF